MNNKNITSENIVTNNINVTRINGILWNLSNNYDCDENKEIDPCDIPFNPFIPVTPSYTGYSGLASTMTGER
jgi:hypothetical protein